MPSMRKGTQRCENMTSQQRMTYAMSAAAPVQQFTPDQEWFRSMGVGRMPANVQIGAHAPVYHVRAHDDGTCDVMPLEADADAYISLGGRGARDYRHGSCQA